MWNNSIIMCFYNGVRASSILLRNPNYEGRYNLNQPLKKRNQGYLLKKKCLCLSFLSLIRILFFTFLLLLLPGEDSLLKDLAKYGTDTLV